MKPSHNRLLAFGINGSLRKREVQAQASNTEYYLFNSAANMKAYSNNGLDFAYYGYNASNTRSYKLSMLNQNQWVNGQPQPLNLQLQSAMFYPNAYINFNQNGEYTKHYYNGSERIASRLGSSTQPTDATSNDRLNYRLMRAEEKFRENIQELVSEWHPVDFQGTVDLNSLQPVNATSDIFYYHTNHLGSTAFVTDQNQNITQGFLYAPFGEITTEYAPMWQNGTLPKYAFNAKELDEETGMYYYEARYYKPPVFTSRDPMMDQKPWLTPYHYCSNNPIGRVDPSGMMDDWYEDANGIVKWDDNVTSQLNTPKGGTYIGKKNTDILKHYGFNYNPSARSSNKIGFIAIDENIGYHMTNVKSKTTLSINANISQDENAKTVTNKKGYVFTGITITARNTGSNTGSIHGKIETAGSLNVNYGGETFTENLTTPNGSKIYTTGTSITEASITLPSSILNTNKILNSAIVRGNWGVRTSVGYTPVVLNGLFPFPRSYKHEWIFKH